MLAQRACQGTGRRNPGILDVLGAAFAEAGQFDQAATAARQAAQQARQAGDGKLAAAIEKRASGYQAGRPWRARR